jgi:hypothetical protein
MVEKASDWLSIFTTGIVEEGPAPLVACSVATLQRK